MNQTLVYLALQNVFDSPFRAGVPRLFIEQCNFGRFFNSFAHGVQNVRVYNSRFYCFLNSGIVVSGASRVTASDTECNVRESSFINMTTTVSGSAVYMTNCIGTVDHCYFENCVATKQGGAVYHSGNTLNMFGNRYYKCNAVQTDNNAGRCFISISGARFINCSQMFRSMPDNGGDSTFSLVTGTAQIQSLNITQCFGSLGAIGGEIFNVDYGSSYSYTMINGGLDYCILYTYLKPFNYTNFVILGVAYSSDRLVYLPDGALYMNIYNSVIWNCTKAALTYTQAAKVFFFSTISNYNYKSPITVVSVFPGIPVQVDECLIVASFSIPIVPTVHPGQIPHSNLLWIYLSFIVFY